MEVLCAILCQLPRVDTPVHQVFKLPFDHAIGLLVVLVVLVAVLGAHGFLKLFPEFTSECSTLI